MLVDSPIFRRIALTVRSLLRRRTLERDMREELSAHLEQSTDRLIARGMSPREARLAARREFGNIGQHQEEARRARGGQWLDALAGDIRFARRHFARTPFTTATIIIVLSLGLGANSALFSVIQAVTARPAPGIPSDDALVRIRGWQRGTGDAFQRGFSYAEVQAYAAQEHLFSDVAAWTSADVTTDAGDTDHAVLPASAHFVTPNYLNVLRVPLLRGSGFPATGPGELSTELVAIISHGFWEQHFAKAPDVLGKSIAVNDVRVTIVGVTPPAFVGVNAVTRPRTIWLPLATRAVVQKHGSITTMSGDSARLAVVARLQPGVHPEQASEVVRAIGDRLAGPPPSGLAVRERSTDVVPLLGGNTHPGSDAAEVIAIASLAGLALLVFAIICTTVSTLLVSGAIARRKEMGIRLALGASRGRIIGQLLTESALLATVAGVLGLVVLKVLTNTLGARVFDSDIEPGWETIAFTLVFSAGIGVLFGLSPALHATRVSISEVLKDGASAVASSRSRLQRSLIVLQVALTQPVLIGVATLLSIVVQDAGPGPGTAIRDRIVKASFTTYAATSRSGDADETLRRLRERLALVPGITGALPYSDGRRELDFRVHPADRVNEAGAERFPTRAIAVVPGYFALIGLPIVRGRDFSPDDVAAPSVPIIIGSDLARELWGTAEPLARRFQRSSRAGDVMTEGVVVGVFDAASVGTTVEMGGRRVYMLQDPRALGSAARTIYIRTREPAEPMIPSIRALIKAEAPDIPLSSLATLEAIEMQSRAASIQVSGMAAAGGMLALFLSSIGLYAVVAFAVAQRTREIGIRMALGARQLQVVGMFLRNGVRLSLIGLAIGLPVSVTALLVIARLLAAPVGFLPFVSIAVAGVVLMVASFAAWLPARRAAMVDPLAALRTE